MLRFSFFVIILSVTFPVSFVNSQSVSGYFIEQKNSGLKEGLSLLTYFDGLGDGFEGPQGITYFRNPSDNSLAVGLDHIVQTVNSRMAVFTKQGQKFSKTGDVLYGPGETRNVFKGFGGPCEEFNNGDAVVRYDQFVNRWLIVMPTFRRGILKHDTLPFKQYPNGVESGNPVDPGPAVELYKPSYQLEERPLSKKNFPPDTVGYYCMCYAISTTPDPLGSYYRYEFRRDRFPDYPRPAIWHDGYYTSTSTGDHLNERHAYVVERDKMLKGLPATEQWFILPDINFIIYADVDGMDMPEKDSPAVFMATGGDQLNHITQDDGIYFWKHFTNWEHPGLSKLIGPEKIQVAPYQYLGGGQLTKAVPQPDTDMRLDAQGDKIMARLVYRNIKGISKIVGVHSVATSQGSGGIRWYEFNYKANGKVTLFKQGTYGPDQSYRWMASPALDSQGNLFIGFSFADHDQFPGQRVVAKSYNFKQSEMDFNEIILVQGRQAQTNTLRWQDYTQTAVDPMDDDMIWYVGDYLKKGASDYSTRIAAVKIIKPKK